MALAAATPSGTPSRRRPTVGVLAIVLLAAVLVPIAAFAAAGALFTIGVFVVPLLIVGAVLYLVATARREAPRAGPDQGVGDAGPGRVFPPE
jgi:hypothetical protein